jgi:hypothetical protein
MNELRVILSPQRRFDCCYSQRTTSLRTVGNRGVTSFQFASYSQPFLVRALLFVLIFFFKNYIFAFIELLLSKGNVSVFVQRSRRLQITSQTRILNLFFFAFPGLTTILAIDSFWETKHMPANPMKVTKLITFGTEALVCALLCFFLGAQGFFGTDFMPYPG